MKYSFIIASINREQQLQRCIESVKKAFDYRKGFDVEVLVILQDSEEREPDARNRYDGLVTFYHIYGKGLSRARNFAIRMSKGDLLIFLDDDAQIKEDFLTVLSKTVLTNSAGAFCGRIFEEGTDRPFNPCFMNDKIRYLTRGDFRYFLGSAHILRKSTIEKVGLYDERFGVGAVYPGAEETDIFFRLKRQGIDAVYLPGLIYYHKVSYGPKLSGYSYATGAMLTKQIFSDKRNLCTYLLILAENILKNFLYGLRSIFFPESIRLKNKKFRFLVAFLAMLKGVFDYTQKSLRSILCLNV